MKIKHIVLFAIIISQILILKSVNSQSLTFTNGKLDVTQTNLDNKIIKLEGYTDFYWKEFLIPSSAKDTLAGHTKLKALIPKTWTKITLPSGENIPPNGYGTYRFQIKVKNKDEIYGLKFYSIFSAYKLYINGSLKTCVGTASEHEKKGHPKFISKEIAIPVTAKDSAESQILDIVLHVSNYHHRKAGAQQPMFFGTLENIVRHTKNDIILQLLLIGIILIIGFNHLLMYLFRRLDFANLIFGILSLIMIIRILSTGERVIMYWLPNLSWELLVRLDNFSGFATMSFFSIYFFFLFRKSFPKIMFYILTGIGILVTILVFSTKAWFYGEFRLIFEAYIGLGGLYLTFVVLLGATIKKRSGAFFTFIGMFLLYTTAIHDVLNSMGVIHNADIAPYGIAIFMVLQSFLLTKKSAIAQKDNEKLSTDLRQEKLNLEERIEERTQKLTNQANELKKYQEEQEEQNHINEGLHDITEVMRKNKENLNKLADQLLTTLIKRIDATMGALYLQTKIDNEDKLKLLANYGLNKEAIIDVLDVNEGLTGQCYSMGKAEYLEDMPEKYFSISSGLGSSTPKILALIPMKIDELVIGVIEIASFKTISETHKAFLTKSIENIAAQLNIVKMSNESQAMVGKYKKIEEESSAKNQEMLENLEELKAVQEEAEKRETEMQDLLDRARNNEDASKTELKESKKQLTHFKKRLSEATKEFEKLKKKKKIL